MGKKQAVKLLALAGFITLSLAASTAASAGLSSQKMTAVKQKLAERQHNSHNLAQRPSLKNLEDLVAEPRLLAQTSSS